MHGRHDGFHGFNHGWGYYHGGNPYVYHHPYYPGYPGAAILGGALIGSSIANAIAPPLPPQYVYAYPPAPPQQPVVVVTQPAPAPVMQPGLVSQQGFFAAPPTQSIAPGQQIVAQPTYATTLPPR